VKKTEIQPGLFHPCANSEAHSGKKNTVRRVLIDCLIFRQCPHDEISIEAD
jgi:hypothetical protein